MDQPHPITDQAGQCVLYRAVDASKRRVEEGSWFRGKLYVMRCDVSFDGKHMVYLAMGSHGTWNGVCRLPWLATLTEAENMGGVVRRRPTSRTPCVRRIHTFLGG